MNKVLEAGFLQSKRPIGGRKPVAYKQKTHSGAKKRFQVLASGKVKRKQTRLRHLNSHMKSKVKRHLGDMIYVDAANMLQIRRCLIF